MSDLQQTQDHEIIKKWITNNQGTPARLSYESVTTDADPYAKDPLTVWFEKDQKEDDKVYQALDWEEWFAVFDHHDFVFHYSKEGKERGFVVK